MKTDFQSHRDSLHTPGLQGGGHRLTAFYSTAKPGNSSTNQVTEIWLKNYKHTTRVLGRLTFYTHTWAFSKPGRNFAYEADGFKSALTL